MPATRVTIAQNAKQSRKAPLLVPTPTSLDPFDKASIRALVFNAAQSKFRLKKPCRIFVGGTGQELVSEEDWKTILRDDVVLLVSAGEEYVGVNKDTSVHDVNPSCPVHILAQNAPVEQDSITQLETTARTLPGIIHAVGQPDLHPGTKFPIGAVFVSRKWIHPPLIGGDIGCGMAWYKTDLNRYHVDGDKGKKIAEKLRGLEGPWRNQTAREQWLRDETGSCSAGEAWDRSLGTIGAGNHFAEIQVVESADNVLDLQENDVILLVHSGSRGYGGSILKKYTKESHISFEDSSEEAQDYMQEHGRACRWAKANRDLIALRFLSCLEPGEEAWGLGHNDSSTGGNPEATNIDGTKAKLQERKVVDIWHNNVERARWPPSPPTTLLAGPEDTTGNFRIDEGKVEHEYVYIHRKGAAPTYDPLTNTPLTLLPLPGSRGTPTFILTPTFSASTTWGLKNALSLAHGAGRSMSRAKALSSLSQKYKGQNILEPSAADKDGTWVVCDEKDLVFQEAPDAYKDVGAVGGDLVSEGVASVVGVCRARVSYKVRSEAR